MEPGLSFTEFDTRIAAYAVIVDGGNVLLTWYNGRGRGEPGWTLPGGGVEFQETCEEGTVREIREETGYGAELLGLLAVHSWTLERDPVRRRPYKSLRVVFEGQIVDGTLGTLEVDGSTDEARWWPLAEIAGQPRADIVDVGLQAWHSRHAADRR